MKTLKKWIAFMLAAGLIVSAVKVTAMTVLADDSYSYSESEQETFFDEGGPFNNHDYSTGGLYFDSDGTKNYYGIYPPTDAASGSSWMDMGKEGCYVYDGTIWYDEYHDVIYVDPRGGSNDSDSISSSSSGDPISSSSGDPISSSSGDSISSSSGDPISSSSGGLISSDGDSSSSSSLTSEEIIANAVSQAADAAEQQGASGEGFLEVGDMYRAVEKNMSAGEYYNNVVISTPGIENAVTVGQGGNIVVNGVVTNMTAMISKVTNRSYADSVRVNQPEGRLLNVVEVSYPGFDATINFYMPSVTAEMDITALQYSAGTWVDVDVVEVREDHVVLNMKKSGIVAFVAK